MKSTKTILVIVCSLLACVGAIWGWLLSGGRQEVHLAQGGYEQHG